MGGKVEKVNFFSNLFATFAAQIRLFVRMREIVRVNILK